jgi:hypothetical protein
MSLNITITCNGKKKFRVWAEELGKRNSKYAEREIIVENSRVIYFSFPVSPKQLYIGCGDVSNPQSKDFTMKVEEAPLKTFDIWMDEDTEKFVQMAVNFSQVCGFKKPAPEGTMYSTKDGMYNIKNFPIIKDAATGRPLSTPARIGHRTGIIEVSAVKFAKYTIPMRVCILLHEFSHKFKNPNIGLQISNEFGADINGLYIYLGLGFSKVDAICVFANVFLKAQSEGNIQRMRKILDYINRFEQQEFARLT